jgi:hypothetical protein
MQSKPENKPPSKRRRSILVAFALAGTGLLLLDEVADSVHLHPLNLMLALQIVLGLVLLVLAVWWGTRRD